MTDVLRIAYNRDCPVCALGARMAERSPAGPGRAVEWVNVRCAPQILAELGVGERAVWHRVMAITPDGRRLVGADVAGELGLWLPQWRAITAPCRWPLTAWAMRLLYELVAWPLLGFNLARTRLKGQTPPV